tara:strand:+ start:12824 stop:14959 length:2136 start_codon:yes stop_codon:yes gene_type:complete
MALTHEQIKKMHDKAYNNGYDTRLKAADDSLFAWVTQWDDTYLAESDLGYRGEFNILRKAMRQIITDLISNPISVDFDPVDETDDSAADIMDGMYRADMRNNTSQEAKKNANQEVVVCGVAAWELRNEWKTNRAGDERQVIKRYPLYEANNNVMWDPNAKLLDKSDATYVSCLVSYSEDGYKALQEELGSDAPASPFAAPEISYVFPWISEDKKVHVSRFFHREKKKVKYLTFVDMFGTEQTIKESDFKEYEDKFVDEGFNLEGEKEVTRYVVTRYIVSGGGILETKVIPGEHIPVIPQYGERQFVEGEEHYEGIVRLSKDPQRLRNFQMSYLADIVSRSPREKPIFTQEQIQGYEDMYEVSGPDNNYPYMKQNATDAQGNPLPVGPVGYIKAPEVPPALSQSMMETRIAVDDVAGAGLPADITDVDISGKALNALNKRLDMQSYTYQDNHKFAMRRDGEVYASMARDVHDTEQEITVVKIDGSASKETINKSTIEYDEVEGVINNVLNDVSNMMFEVYADIGPAFESVKAQNKEEIKELLNGLTPGTPQHTILLNEYLTMTDGMAFKDLREYGRKELIMMGVKETETPEEEEMLARAQQEQANQTNPEDTLMQIELLKQQTLMLAQQNKAQELQLKLGQIQLDAQGRQQKLQSDLSVSAANIEQEQQKIDNKAFDDAQKNAIKLTEVEVGADLELNKQVNDNMRANNATI